ncbi:MAG: hypothetical protein K6U74_10750, partial [Firmicutes bacterium]|nr:hypothetical protein [Bacillota bacterium]
MRNRSRNRISGFAVTLFLLALLFTLGTTIPAQAADVTLTADEQQMASLLNKARANCGLAPLTVDPTLSGLARIKAQDMVSNNYFSHNSPTYGTPYDMLKAAGVQYECAGENLAKAASVSKAFNALQNYSGFRSNIQNKNYDKVGVGVIPKGSYKIVVIIYTGGQTVSQPAPEPQPQPEPPPHPPPEPPPPPPPPTPNQ